jgi:hypothetical protein
MIKSVFSKLLIVAILLSFYSCGTPANTETTEETTTDTEVLPVVSAENTREQENLEYAEKQEATNQAISFYEALKSGLYEKTTQMVEPKMYKDFSEASWLEMLKKADKKMGTVEKYSLQSSKYEKVEGTNSGRKVETVFEVTRNSKKYVEEIYWYKTDGEPFMLTKIEYKTEGSTEEDDD